MNQHSARRLKMLLTANLGIMNEVVKAQGPDWRICKYTFKHFDIEVNARGFVHVTLRKTHAQYYLVRRFGNISKLACIWAPQNEALGSTLHTDDVNEVADRIMYLIKGVHLDVNKKSTE